MVIIHNFTMALDRRGVTPVVDAVQGDSLTRKLAVTLTENGSEAWPVPAGVTAGVAFRKPDGHKGLYDTLPDGGNAVTVSANMVTAVLAPEVLSCAGETWVAIVLHDENLKQIATFPVCIRVAANPAAGVKTSNDYYNYSTMEEVNAAIDEAFAAIREAEENCAPAIVCEESGSNITLNDSANRLVQGLNLYGKTTQVKTTGKNLYSGGDLSVTKSTLVTLEKPLSAGGYIISANVTSTGTSYCSISFVGGATDGANVNVALDKGNGKSKAFTLGKDGVTEIRFNADSSYDASEGDTATFKNIQIELGSTATAYEPYTGGKPSPSVDYPQDLVSAGNSGNIGVGVVGKNLFDPSFFTKNGFTETDGVYSGDTIRLHYNNANTKVKRVFIEGKENTQYTFSCKCKAQNEDKNVYLYAYFGYTDGTSSTLTINDVGEASKTHTTTAGKTLWRISFSYGTSKTASFWDVQLEEGTQVTAFEPYKSGGTLTASTPNGLPGIPVTSGGNYTDENGQRWVCDEIDFARGVRITRLAELVFDGVSNGKRIYSTDPSQLEASKTSIYAYMNYGYINPPALSSTKVYANYSGVSLSTAISITRSKAWLGLPQGEALTTTQVVTAYNTKLKELYDAGKPVRVLYQRKTPVETPLSAEELAAYAAMHTNKPNTTVYNDAGAGMKLQYVADTKTYIDKKFNELATALVNNM